MGLSGIAKAPVSHGVEPHDLETGGLALASALAFRLYRSSLSPPLPRERFSARAESRPTGSALGRSAVRAIATTRLRARGRHNFGILCCAAVSEAGSVTCWFWSIARGLQRVGSRGGRVNATGSFEGE